MNPVAQTDGQGHIEAFFVYGFRPNVPEFLIKKSASTLTQYRVVSDHLGSVRGLVQLTGAGAGTVLCTAVYGTWGKLDTAHSSPNGCFDHIPFGFAGGLHDAKTGFYRFGARDYDPRIGRWLSKDPIKFDGGLNFYAYAGNDPVNYQDVTGLAMTSCGPNPTVCLAKITAAATVTTRVANSPPGRRTMQVAAQSAPQCVAGAQSAMSSIASVAPRVMPTVQIR